MKWQEACVFNTCFKPACHRGSKELATQVVVVGTCTQYDLCIMNRKKNHETRQNRKNNLQI